jgi:hypothetical protein
VVVEAVLVRQDPDAGRCPVPREAGKGVLDDQPAR